MLNLGLIGAGRWGRRYIHTLRNFQGARLVRLASSNPESTSLVDTDCSITADWREVATDKTLDGIILATPPALHAEMAEVALESGLHVLVEKPMTLSIDDALRLVELSRANRRMIFVGHTHLFSNAFRTLKNKSSELGALMEVRSSAGNWGPYRADTNVLWDWSPHDIAMCLELLGCDPVTLSAKRTATAKLPEGDGEAVEIMLRFPKGIRASIRVSNIDHQKSRFFEARYEKGSLIYDDIVAGKLKLVTGADPEGMVLPVGTSLPLDNLLSEFILEIRAGSVSHASMLLGVRVVKLIAECEAVMDFDE